MAARKKAARKKAARTTHATKKGTVGAPRHGSVSQREVAAHLCMNVSSVSNLVANSIIPPLSHADTTLDAVREAYITHLRARGKNADFNDARARHEAAKAGKAELDLRVQTGELVPGEVLDIGCETLCSEIRSRMYGSVGKLADASRTSKDRREALPRVRDIFDSIFDNALDAAKEAMAEALRGVDDAA